MSSIPGIKIDSKRLASRLEKFAQFGATQGGGIHRTALSPNHLRARKHLLDVAREHGWPTAIDSIGNIYVTRPGSEADAAPLAVGSHLDSQPNGGRFDGTYGVVAGLEALEALDEADASTRRGVVLVDWMNEEGARFAPSLMGSMVRAGVLSLDTALAATDSDGLTVGENLKQWLPLPQGKVPTQFHAYIELHIEQGPILEDRGAVIAVVEGVQGITQFDISLTGRAAHAGTTPTANRRDALVAAGKLVVACDEAALSDPDLRLTVGDLRVEPGARNVVPSHATLKIDLRHPQRQHQLSWTQHVIDAASKIAAASGLEVSIVEHMDQQPTVFHPNIRQAVQRAAQAHGYSPELLFSGAGHDAVPISSTCPTGMIFIPCVDGVSHAEDEAITDEWAVSGAQVLLTSVLELSQ